MPHPDKKYEVVIGLEIHIQLNTATKAFCGDPNLFGADPNTLTSIISLGHPGTLPMANVKQIEYAARLGLALGCEIARESYFDRKNYFYPDLPKGYQITQDNCPICVGGEISIPVKKGKKTIRLTRIHMEEDAGKSVHDLSAENTMIDLNRAGVPLLEVVTEPDLRAGEEAYALLGEFRKLIRYLGISDGNMEEGSMRCDCNVSVRPFGQETYGTRCEIKNVNSMRNAMKAIKYEAKRQIQILEAGGSIDQETRSFDASTGDTENVLRTKEDAHDYRYFPDPDLPVLQISETQISEWRASLPALPWELEKRMIEEFKLKPKDANVLVEEQETAAYFFRLAEASGLPKQSANWLLNPIRAWLNSEQLSIADFPLTPEKLAQLIQLSESSKINKLGATQQLLPALIQSPEKDPLELAKELNLIIEEDQDQVRKWAEMAVAKYPEKVEAFRRGKKGLMGLFMGEVMKLSKGQVDPLLAKKTIEELLKG